MVKNFDLCFRVHYHTERDRGWRVRRNPMWKMLLPKNFPLALWPYFLAKTNTWNGYTSHTPLDALFFLTREQCDVLLQNVRRRKIRKRKRFQFSS